MINLLRDYENLSKVGKENMSKALKTVGLPNNFKAFARRDKDVARRALNGIIQMGENKLMIEGVDGTAPDHCEKTTIYPDYNPNKPNN